MDDDRTGPMGRPAAPPELPPLWLSPLPFPETGYGADFLRLLEDASNGMGTASWSAVSRGNRRVGDVDGCVELDVELELELEVEVYISAVCEMRWLVFVR
jgi:hypothetical protein